jgi:hypothetical protein
MAQVAIQLSDEDLKRLRAHAEAHEITPEQAAADVVRDSLHAHDPWLGFATEDEYQAWIQEGIDSAENEPLIDADIVFERAQKRLDALLAARKS